VAKNSEGDEMNYKRNDITISAVKYASIIGVEKSDVLKLMEHKKVKTLGKGEFDINQAIEAIEPHINKEEIKRKVHSFFIMKGGTGKTLTCYNMGHYLALLGYKVLLIDLDPQCNLTTQCGIEYDELGVGDDILDILKGKKTITECIVPIIRNVDLIKGSEVISEADEFLKNKAASDFILDKKMKDEKIKERYDFIFFDNHSSVSKASNNAFIVSDSIISVGCPDRYTYNGLEPVLSAVQDLSATLNKDIRFNVLLNNFDPTIRAQKISVDMIIEKYGKYLFNNYVKKSSDFVNSTLTRQPFFSFSGNTSNALKDYAELLVEFIEISSNKTTQESTTEDNHGIA
jgi:chromosome partitioning protein